VYRRQAQTVMPPRVNQMTGMSVRSLGTRLCGLFRLMAGADFAARACCCSVGRVGLERGGRDLVVRWVHDSTPP